MKAHYTKAVIALLESGHDVDQVLSGLVTTLRSHSHYKLYGSILQGVARALHARGATTASLIIAKADDEAALRDAIAAALTKLQASKPTVHVDPSIIGGYIVEANGQRVDASYKKSLITLYQNLTT